MGAGHYPCRSSSATENQNFSVTAHELAHWTGADTRLARALKNRFPWLVSDFGLADAIECGIVKIPRLPVADDKAKTDEAGRPDPKYFRLWHHIITDKLQPNEKIANRPKPDAI